MSQMTKQGEKALHPSYLGGGILKKYVYDAKQWFETMVVPQSLCGTLLKLSHDDLGHNGTAQTYMLLRWNYYWKGMRPEVTRYVKQCKLCQTHNSAYTRYVKGTFEVPKVSMDFISMDLIGKFNPPSSQGNKFTLTIICMLSSWTWCIPIVDKLAPSWYKLTKRTSTTFSGHHKKFYPIMVQNLRINSSKLLPKNTE